MQIAPIATRFVLTTGHVDGQVPRYYTGRGGEGWLGAKAESFTYGEEAARRKAELLNRSTASHGFTFWVEAA